MKILYVEDEIAHVELTERTLEDNFQDGFVLYHKESLQSAMELILSGTEIDIVLADLRLPDGSGLDLLYRIRELPSPPPVVLVTGQGDQDVAVKALKAGAADYLVKQSDYLHRLPVVISNAVAQNQLEREQAALRAVEQRFQILVEQMPAAVYTDKADELSSAIYVSPHIEDIVGYTPEEWTREPLFWLERLHPEDRERVLTELHETFITGRGFNIDYRLLHRDGHVVWVRDIAELIKEQEGKADYWQGILYDITNEKKNEAALQRQLNELSVLQSATAAGTEGFSEDEIIDKVTRIVGRIYNEVCGVLLLNEDGTMLTPHPSYIGADISNWQNGYPITEGVTGRCVSLGRIIRLGDVRDDTQYIQIASNINSELCAPISVNKRVIGVINVESRLRDAYNENDERLLGTLASTLGSALERSRLFGAEQQRSRELDTLYQTTKLLTQSLEPKTIAESLITILERFLGYEYCIVSILDENKQILAPLAVSRKGKDQAAYERDMQSLAEQEVHLGVGISGWVVQHGLPVRSGNVLEDPRYLQVMEGIRSELCVPLISRGKSFGVLNIETSKPDAYTEKDENLLTALASSAAIAFENARLFQEQTRRSRIIEALAEIANEIATTRDVLPALEKISQSALELLHANHVAIYLLQDDNITLKPVTAWGTYRNEILSHVRKIGEGVTGSVFLKAIPEIVNNLGHDMRKIQVPGTPKEDANFETLMSCPLILRGKPIGVINAWRLIQDGLFNETELNFLVSIANQASICIESGRLFQETKRQAQEAAAIAEVGRYISSTLQLDVVLERIASYARDLLDAEATAVYLFDENTSTLTAIAAIGQDSVEIKNDPLPLGVGILGNIAKQKVGEFVNDTVKDPRAVIVKGTEQNPFEHIMGVPILFSNKLTGLLAVWRSGDGLEFNQDELDFSGRLAQQAAFAIENARLYQAEFVRREQAETLRAVTASLSTTLDINALYEIILDSLSRLIPHDSASIFLEHARDEMEIVAVRGFADPARIIGKVFVKDIKWHDLVSKGMVLIMSNAQTDPRFEKWEESEHIRGWMGVPMISQDKVVGFINLDSRKVDTFTERDATLAQTFANSAAVAIQNAILFNSQREQFEREASILSLMRAAAASLDLDQVLHTILNRLIKLLKADSGSIQLLENDRLRVASAVGFDPALFARNSTIAIKTFPLNEQAITRQEAILVDDATKDPRYMIVKGLETTRSFLLIPLISKGISIGLITLDHTKPGYFTSRDIETCVAIADNASIAITNARLYQDALRATERRAVLHRISQEIIRISQDTEQVYAAIHETAEKLMSCDVFMIALQDQKSGEINFAYTVETGRRYHFAKSVMTSTGITGKVLSMGTSLIWSDEEEISKNNVEHFGAAIHVQSVIGVPMKSGDRTVGIISAQSYKPNAYGAEEQALLEMLATHAVTAIENTRLYDETQRRLKELEAINRVSMSLRLAQSLDEMLPILLNETLQLVDTHHGSIWLYDHSSNMLRQQISSGAESNLKHTAILPHEGIVGNTFTTGKMYISPELKSDPLLFEGNRESIASGLAGISIPIQSTAGPVGVLMVSVETGHEFSDEVNLLLILSEITGNAIHRSQLYEQSQRQVRRLTTLRDIDAAIASSFDLRLTLNILVDQTLSHLGVDAVDIALYHPDIQSISYLVSNGFHTPSPTRPQTRVGEGLAGQVILRQQTFHVTDLQNAPETRNEVLIKREGFLTYIGIPLIIKGQIKGVFEIFQRSNLTPTPDWMDFLHTLAGQAAIAIDNSHLFENLQRSNQELIQAYDTTLEGWARALELRDRETEGHTRRVTEMTLRLARYMDIKDSELVNIRRGVLLHDIGKMGVRDDILRKPGKLTESEWEEMRKHPIYAYNLLSPIEYLRDALDIPYCHHEHWDGSGYPRGLKGTQIPLAARIFSIIDIWDALLSDRPYRKAWKPERVIAHLKEISGKYIDPNILQIFLKMIEETEIETG